MIVQVGSRPGDRAVQGGSQQGDRASQDGPQAGDRAEQMGAQFPGQRQGQGLSAEQDDGLDRRVGSSTTVAASQAGGEGQGAGSRVELPPLRYIGCTRTHNPASAGAAKGHQALLRGAEDVVHNYSKCGHHAQLRHHTVDIGSNGKCSCREDHEKRCSQMENSQHA